MATEFRLTPMPKNRPRRWRKIDDRLPRLDRSRVWYCRVRRGETKEQSYRRCWAEWRKIEQQLVGLDAPPVYQVTATTIVQYDPPRPTEDGAPLGPLPAELQGMEYRRVGVTMETLPQLVAEVENPEQFVKGLVVHQQDGKPSETVATELAPQFQAKEGLAKAGQRAIKTADRFKQKVEHFVRWVGPAFPIASITSPTLLDYHGKLCVEIAVDGVSKWRRRAAEFGGAGLLKVSKVTEVVSRKRSKRWDRSGQPVRLRRLASWRR